MRSQRPSEPHTFGSLGAPWEETGLTDLRGVTRNPVLRTLLGPVSIHADFGTVFKGSDLAPFLFYLFIYLLFFFIHLEKPELKTPLWRLRAAVEPS